MQDEPEIWGVPYAQICELTLYLKNALIAAGRPEVFLAYNDGPCAPPPPPSSPSRAASLAWWHNRLIRDWAPPQPQGSSRRGWAMASTCSPWTLVSAPPPPPPSPSVEGVLAVSDGLA
jgi:hypothetical protein